MKLFIKKNREGAALISIILILTGAMLMLFLALARVAIFSISDSYEQEIAWEMREELFGCLDEVLIHLAGYSSYSTTSVTIDGATCSVSITTPQEGQRNIYLEITNGDISRGVFANISLEPFAVNSVDEQLD